MLAHFRQLSRDVIIYGMGRIGLKLFSFITLPIFTRIFSPDDYGIIETISTFTSAVAVFITLGLESASQRSYFDYSTQEREERRAVLGTAFWTLLVWSVALAIMLIVTSHSLAIQLFGESRYAQLLRIAIIAISVTTLTNFFQEILRLRHQPVRYSLLSIFSGMATIGLMLYLVAVRGWGLLGNYLGLLLGALLTVGPGYWLVRDALSFIFSRRELHVMLAYGLPLLPVAASTWVMQLADRFFLLHYAPMSEVGLYGLGVRLSNLLLLGVTVFGIAWSPFILELHSREPLEERRVRARVLIYVALVLSFGAVCLSVFAREFFLTITAPSFVNAYQVVGLLSISIVAIGINGVTMTGITLSRQTHYFARYTIYTAVLNLGLNFLLIPPWGMVGAALATLLTYASLAWLYFRRAQILDPVPYDVRRLLIVLVTAAVLIALGTFINLTPLWLSIIAKVPLVLAFPLLVWLLGGLDPQALVYLHAMVRQALVRAGALHKSVFASGERHNEIW